MTESEYLTLAIKAKTSDLIVAITRYAIAPITQDKLLAKVSAEVLDRRLKPHACACPCQPLA